jgi:tRNA A-37 threonylcarbamoyl transferase component Bud32
LNRIHPDYSKEISDIEDRINRYEQASFYMRGVESQLQQMGIIGFDEDVQEIKNHLNDLQSYEAVKEMMKHLKIDIDNYRIDYNLLKTELDKLPDTVIDTEKRKEIQLLLASPRTINKAKALIKNTRGYIDKRDRLCFPRELTQYTDESLIGTGGFSRVYKARNIEKNRIVAVKIPIKNDANIGKSFLRELNNWVSLDHVNIVKIYQYNILPIPYIEMEWCDLCLDNIEKPVQFNLATHYIRGVAEGLEYAHQKNIAHFDLKPQNILLKNDVPKITDWGLSRLLTLQKTTTIGISLPFAAPEQFSTRYGKRDSRTDIWQLGILYYYILTNDIPFSGTDFAEYGKDVTTKNIKKVISEDASLQDVKHILIKCLARQKKNRYDSVSCFLKDIKEIM